MIDLIANLQSIYGMAKDIHYNYKTSPEFYSIHLLMDRVSDDYLDFIDSIKENYFMYNQLDIPTSAEIFIKSAELNKDVSIPELINLLKLAVYSIEQIKSDLNLDLGDDDLLGRISSKLKNDFALVSKVL